MSLRRLLFAVSAAVLAGCNCTPAEPPVDAGSQCTTAADCGATGSECVTATCVNAACGTAPVTQGTAVSAQTPGDCKRNECDGLGAVVSVSDATDLVSDDNECTVDSCGVTGPVYASADAGVSCGAGGLLRCDGAGQCVGCGAAADCPGQDSECFARSCSDAGVCGADFTAVGTVLTAQVPGDCQQAQCDGDGGIGAVALATDVADDGLECTTDTCAGTTPTSTPVSSGTACTQGGGTLCNSAGACVQCVAATDCSGTDSECQARTCTNFTCGVAKADAGTPLSAQTAADCLSNVCDGDGGIANIPDDADLPVDNVQCTTDVCTSGVASNPPAASGAVCTDNGGVLCNGAGACVECVAAATCPGADAECQTRTCSNNTCGFTYALSGTALTAQTAGDCRTAVCDGAGGTASTNTDSDLPSDSLECTTDTCASGAPTFTPVTAGTSCSQNGGLVCSAAGVCVGCVVAADCAGTDTECQTRTCTNNTCGFSFSSSGTALSTQMAGDCRRAVCDGAGGTMSANDDADLPSDGLQCTADTCVGGVPTFSPVGAGTACTQNGGTTCDGAGVCVGCVTASACPGSDTECQTRTCTAGVCGFNFASAGTVLAAQTAGDCRTAVCDGSGGSATTATDSDLPVDGLQCTADVCTSGAPTNPAEPAGTVCAQSGGTRCNGLGACVECLTGSHCGSGVCTGFVCQAATCADGVRNGAETDLDCGGGACPACAPTLACANASDCQSGMCSANVCGSPAVVSVSPGDGATGVASNAAVSVTFTAAMRGVSLTVQSAPGPCTGAVQVSTDDFASCIGLTNLLLSAGDTVATVTPVGLLAGGTRYRVRVTTGAQDAFSNPLGAAFTLAQGFFAGFPGSSCGVVISQVYGGGGNAGSTWTNDFIELKNQGTAAVSLAGWSVQYTSATGAGTWSVTTLPAITLQPGAFFLVQQAAGTGGTTPLPAPDATGTIGMAGTAGKVALVNSPTALAGGCPTSSTIVDLVGYGTTASCFRGAGPTPTLSNTTAALRGGVACADGNVNATDFAPGFPTPRNTASASSSCSACGVGNETDVPAEADYCNLQFPLSITVAPSTVTPIIYGRIFEAGVTETAGDPGTIRVQVGYAPAGVDPRTQCGWQFVAASYNTQVGNDDEFLGTFTSPARPGAYWYTMRFSLDNGATWTFGDVDGAGSNGGLDFSTAQLPVMTVQ